MILTSMKNYFLLTQHLTTEMKTFCVWIAVAEPKLARSTPADVAPNKAIAEMHL